MPPPSNHRALDLLLCPGNFFVIQCGKDTVPNNVLDMLASDRFFSITKTKEETSIVGERFDGMPLEFESKCDWACIMIRGPMEHNMVGVLAVLSAPLKTAGVPIFAMSTWNTDYVLVPLDKKTLAVETLKEDGWTFAENAS